MPALQALVSEATAEKDPQEFEAQRNLLRKVAETAQKQYGAVGARPVSMAPEAADTLAAEKKYKSGEYERRKAAATSGYDLAKQVDTYGTDFSNRVREALYNRQKLKEEVPEGQRRAEESARMGQEETMQQGKQKLAEIQWGGYKSAADRIDAMQSAYDKGILDMQLLDIAKMGALDIADIDRYFTLMVTDLNNKLQAIIEEDKFNQEQYFAKLKAKADSLSAMISGLFNIGGAIVTENLK